MKSKQHIDSKRIINLQEHFEVTIEMSIECEIDYDDPLFEEAAMLISALPVRQADDVWWVYPDHSSSKNPDIWRDCCKRLLILSRSSPGLVYWACDAIIGLGNLSLALSVMPKLTLGTRSSNQADRLLSLKYALGVEVTGVDIAVLFGAKFTKFGRENIGAIGQFLEIRVSELQKMEGRNLLKEWAGDAHVHPSGMSLFSGHPSYIYAENPPEYSFSLSSVAEKFCIHLMREAENTFREEQGIPRVGEGWIGETILFYEIKGAFLGEEVVQHARPRWLGRQHLDIYFPERSVALEYQGEQHDRPVDFFGGEEAFEKNVERDKRKLVSCTRNGVKVIYVREGYKLTEIIDKIISK